jgi:hypothetical protein
MHAKAHAPVTVTIFFWVSFDIGALYCRIMPKERKMKTIFTIAVAAAFAAASPASAADSMVKAGTISINEAQFGFLIGGSTGGGVLRYHGKSYPFKIGGISIGTIGGSHTEGYGTVYNMASVDQFTGTYSKLAASATFVDGSGSVRLKNGNGVILELHTNSKGLQLSANAGGVDISMR